MVEPHDKGQPRQYGREYSADESSPREREAASQRLQLPVEVEEKNDETSWLEEEHKFWEERQDWLVEMEREFHVEPSFEKQEAILKKVAALVEDAQEAEEDWTAAALEDLKLKVEVEAKSSFAQTIEAIQETVYLGKLFLSNYNDLSKGGTTSQFEDEIANSGTDSFASKQADSFTSHEPEKTATSSSQTFKKSNGPAPFVINCRTDLFARAAKALVAYLATSSIFSQQTLSSATSLRSLSALRGLGSLGSLGAASFFLSRLPRAEAREDYFSSVAFSNLPNLTFSKFQYLNISTPSLFPNFHPQSLPNRLLEEIPKPVLERRSSSLFPSFINLNKTTSRKLILFEENKREKSK